VRRGGGEERASRRVAPSVRARSGSAASTVMPPSRPRRSCRCGARSGTAPWRGRLVHRPHVPDHPGGQLGQLGGVAREGLPGRDLEQVRAEPVQRGQQVGLARTPTRPACPPYDAIPIATPSADSAARRRRGAQSGGAHAQDVGRSNRLPQARRSFGSTRLGLGAHRPGHPRRLVELDRAVRGCAPGAGSEAATSRSWVMTRIVGLAFSSAQQPLMICRPARVECCRWLVGEHDRRRRPGAPCDRHSAPRAGAVGAVQSRWRTRAERCELLGRGAGRSAPERPVEQTCATFFSTALSPSTRKTAGTRSRCGGRAARQAGDRTAPRSSWPATRTSPVLGGRAAHDVPEGRLARAGRADHRSNSPLPSTTREGIHP